MLPRRGYSPHYNEHMREETRKHSDVGLAGLLVAGGATIGANELGYSKLTAFFCFVSSLFFAYGIYQANRRLIMPWIMQEIAGVS